MTGYTVHTGSNDRFSKGWDGIFAPKTGSESTSKKSSKTKDETSSGAVGETNKKRSKDGKKKKKDGKKKG